MIITGTLLIGVRFFSIGSVQKIVRARMMQIGQLNQDGRRNIDVAALIVAVYPLAAFQIRRHPGLSPIFVLAQVSDSLVHAYHLKKMIC